MTYGIGIMEPIYSTADYGDGLSTTNNNNAKSLVGPSTLPITLSLRDKIVFYTGASVAVDGDAPQSQFLLRDSDRAAFGTEFESGAFNTDDNFDLTAYRRYTKSATVSSDLQTYGNTTKHILTVEMANTSASEGYSWIFATNVFVVRG